MSDDYDPHSHNAMFSQINERLKTQDKQLELLPQIFQQSRKTNGRVTRLEVIVGGIMFGITTVAGAIILAYFEHVLGR